MYRRLLHPVKVEMAVETNKPLPLPVKAEMGKEVNPQRSRARVAGDPERLKA